MAWRSDDQAEPKRTEADLDLAVGVSTEKKNIH